jgi:hypothetical protein
MLQAMGWAHHLVPFYFKVLDAPKFLDNIAYLRSTTRRKSLLDAARHLRLGQLAFAVLQFRGRSTHSSQLSCEEVPGFGDWVDRIWEEGKSDYSVAAVRNMPVLEKLYPADDGRFIRLKFSIGTRPIGWAVVLDTQMQEHKQFANMRVGSLIDGFCRAEDSTKVVAEATRQLTRRGVDLIVSNQCHGSWCAGLRRAGFIAGPSNYLVALSRGLAKRVAPFEQHKHRMHWTRGDGDGPINL